MGRYGGMQRDRDALIGERFGFRSRAMASPWPMVQTASVALQRQTMRSACRSWSSTPPSARRTSLKEKRSLMTFVRPATRMWWGRLACHGVLGNCLCQFLQGNAGRTDAVILFRIVSLGRAVLFCR